MVPSDNSFNKPCTLHQYLGGGLVADVLLWRQKSISLGILIMALSIWVVFERSGYTLLSLSSSVMLLSITILFIWSKAASLLNRPAPPLPDLYLSEERVAEVEEFVRTHLNALFLVCRDISLGKDSRLFLKAFVCLLLISVVGGFTDFISLCYLCLVLMFTIPVLYDRFQDQVNQKVMCVYGSLQQVYIKLDEYITTLRKLDLDKIQ